MNAVVQATVIVLLYGSIGYLIFWALRGVVRAASGPTHEKLDRQANEVAALRQEVSEVRAVLERIEQDLADKSGVVGDG